MTHPWKPSQAELRSELADLLGMLAGWGHTAYLLGLDRRSKDEPVVDEKDPTLRAEAVRLRDAMRARAQELLAELFPAASPRFCDGAQEYQRHNDPNPCLAEIESGPLYSGERIELTKEHRPAADRHICPAAQNARLPAGTRGTALSMELGTGNILMLTDGPSIVAVVVAPDCITHDVAPRQPRTMGEIQWELARLRSAVHRDQTGLAAALNEIRKIAQGWWWLGEDGTWGSYEYPDRTEQTLRREAAALIEAVTRAAEEALRASGDIADRVLRRGDTLPLDVEQIASASTPCGLCGARTGEPCKPDCERRRSGLPTGDVHEASPSREEQLEAQMKVVDRMRRTARMQELARTVLDLGNRKDLLTAQHVLHKVLEQSLLLAEIVLESCSPRASSQGEGQSKTATAADEPITPVGVADTWWSVAVLAKSGFRRCKERAVRMLEERALSHGDFSLEGKALRDARDELLRFTPDDDLARDAQKAAARAAELARQIRALFSGAAVGNIANDDDQEELERVAGALATVVLREDA